MSAKMIKCGSCGNEISSDAKSCPNCGAKVKKPVYKKWWFWLIIVILFIGIISAAGGDDSGSSVGGETAQTTEAAIVISADELIRAYVNNAVSADAQYKDKLVAVSGTIYSIDDGYITIEPDDDELWLNNIYAYYDSDEISKLADFAKGDRITVTGECKGEGFMGIEIKYCTIS